MTTDIGKVFLFILSRINSTISCCECVLFATKMAPRCIRWPCFPIFSSWPMLVQKCGSECPLDSTLVYLNFERGQRCPLLAWVMWQSNPSDFLQPRLSFSGCCIKVMCRRENSRLCRSCLLRWPWLICYRTQQKLLTVFCYDCCAPFHVALTGYADLIELHVQQGLHAVICWYMNSWRVIG